MSKEKLATPISRVPDVSAPSATPLTRNHSFLRGAWELMRMHRPFWANTLFFWPCAWGLTMAAYSTSLPIQSYIVQFSLFGLGSVLLHSAACVINDICDVDFDRQVERCKNRPLPSGLISIYEAWVVLILLVVLTASMLLFTHKTAAVFGIFGLLPLNALYPLMKRWTWWPGAWLGLAVNWGIPVAWISVTETSRNMLPGWIMLFGAALWTVVYDTMYAWQDREDDMKCGVHSAAILLGERYVRPVLEVFALGFVLSLCLAGFLNDQGTAYFAVTCGGAAIHFVWQFSTWNVSNPDEGEAKYQSNGVIACVIWLGMFLDYYQKTN